MTRRAEMEAFVLEYLKSNCETSCVDQAFHESFYNNFGGTKTGKNWGADPVRKAMTILAAIHSAGILKRYTVSLGSNWQPGFPHSVYSYSLPKSKGGIV